MIQITKQSPHLRIFVGKCECCLTEVKCDRGDVSYNKYDPDEPWKIICPQCGMSMAVYPNPS